MWCFSVRRNSWKAFATLAVFAGVSLGADRALAGAPAWTERVIPLRPGITFVKASFLTGEIDGLRIVERVQPGTGKIIGEPRLEATLTVSNDSRDHAARLLGGKIEYIDGAGRSIPITGNSFVFTTVARDRLDPGKKVSQSIEIAAPPSALRPDGLREISLELIYLPIPYQTDTVNVPVYLGG